MRKNYNWGDLHDSMSAIEGIMAEMKRRVVLPL